MEEVIYFCSSESWRKIGLSWSYPRKPDHVKRCTWADHTLLQASMGSPQSSWEGLIWTVWSNKVTGKQWSPRASPQCELQNSSQLKLQELHLWMKIYWEQCLRFLEKILYSLPIVNLIHTSPCSCFLEGKNMTLQPFLSNSISCDDQKINFKFMLSFTKPLRNFLSLPWGHRFLWSAWTHFVLQILK